VLDCNIKHWLTRLNATCRASTTVRRRFSLKRIIIETKVVCSAKKPSAIIAAQPRVFTSARSFTGADEGYFWLIVPWRNRCIVGAF
jgi:hypothetical protein